MLLVLLTSKFRDSRRDLNGGLTYGRSTAVLRMGTRAQRAGKLDLPPWLLQCSMHSLLGRRNSLDHGQFQQKYGK